MLTPTGGKRYGAVVSINYQGRLLDGTVFDDHMSDEPLPVMLGAKMVPLGIEQALHVMQSGEERTLRLLPEEAFGAIDGEGIITLPRFAVPNAHELESGMMIRWQSPKAPKEVNCLVAEVNQATVTLDFNHPLAGQEVE
ncbi:MAG: FKBP-type peptidyl-prolyl cis-trans isomerase [Coriobacteriales bacterium]|nr:FKBP-type peptidyl-prolyl cis-trans isomerase [Coriobacteriales bacterium]